MEKRHFLIDKYHTWYDWRLTLTAKDIPDPEPKTNYIQLDGVSGSLDLSEALTGEVAYNDRTLTASFMCSEGTHKERWALLRSITVAVHGKKVKIVEPDDPDHFFLGRVTVKNVTNMHAFAEFDLEAICEPWRYAVNETERRVEVSEAVDIVINNKGEKTLLPTIQVAGNVSMTFNGITSALTDGTYKVADLRLTPGANVIGLSGSGSVSFTYREAGL